MKNELCPICGAELKQVIGCYEEITYDGLICPNDCDLWEVYR